MEQLGPLALLCEQKTDDVGTDHRDFLEVEGRAGPAEIELLRNLFEVLGFRSSDHPHDPSSTVRVAL